MPFLKGREKTGGRVSNEEKIRRLEERIKALPKSAKLVDQLAAHGFDFYDALAKALKAVTAPPKDAASYASSVALYDRLTDLLPFMAPKLREKEIDTAEPAKEAPPESAISTEDLLKVFNGQEKTNDKPGASDQPPVEQGSAGVPLSASSEGDLYNLAEQSEEQ